MREQHTMPKDIAAALKNAGLRADYKARPAYQRNDYIGWINRAKTPGDAYRAPRTNAHRAGTGRYLYGQGT